MKQALIALALLASASSASAANLVVNGGFETGDFSGWSSTGDTAGTTVSWQVPHSGTWHADIVPRIGYNHLEQSIQTIAGHTYDVSFYLLHPPFLFVPFNNAFSASFDSQNLLTFTNALGWYQYTHFTSSITASSNSTLLSFNSATEAYYELDDVAVIDITPTGGVPEPASWALMIVGFGAAGAMIRRRKAVLA